MLFLAFFTFVNTDFFRYVTIMLMSGITMEASAAESSTNNSLAPPPTLRRKPSIAAKVSKKLSDVKKSLKNKQAAFLLDLDVGLEEEEPQCRYLPARLDTLCSETGLSREQMKALYRGFKEACPNGAISEPIFRDIYCQMFPMGDGNGYAHYIFKALDKGKTGTLTFTELVRGLTSLVKGSLHERLHWVFRLYDIDHDGEISREEMSAVIGAIHDLVGPSDSLSERHTDLVFEKLDLNSDGVITMDEFMECCYNDEKMCSNFALFDGSW